LLWILYTTATSTTETHTGIRSDNYSDLIHYGKA